MTPGRRRGYIDFHCDTLLESWRLRRDDLREMPGMVDVTRLHAAGALAQWFAIYLPDPGEVDDDEYVAWCFGVFDRAMEARGAGGGLIAPAYSAADVEANERAGRVSALLAFEDGRPIAGSLERLEGFYRRGVRLITLTWNRANCFGFPNSTDPQAMSRGLTPFGREAVARMFDLGMLVDVSHISDAGFRDVAALSREYGKVFVASHSNCRALCPHPRNLSDGMIAALADAGGVAGLNFCPEFLAPGGDSTLDLLAAHLRHLINTGGVGCAALGADFDGIGGRLEFPGAQAMPAFLDGLAARGFTDGEIERIAWGNALRVMREGLGG